MKFFIIALSLCLFLQCLVVQAQERPTSAPDLKYMTAADAQAWWAKFQNRLSKTAGIKKRRNGVMAGNKISTIIYDYGSISAPAAPIGLDLVWNGLGYAYEFGPLVAASVTDAKGQRIHSVVDGFISSADGDYQPGTDNKWGWLPTPGYVDSTQNQLALFSDRNKLVNGKPASWPESWFNQPLGRYVWPSFLGDDATTPDEEALWVMDDETDKRYEYYPFPGDSTRRGLGLKVKSRAFQFNNPLAEDIIFLVYEVTNTSQKQLDTVYFAMFGDPHVGGRGNYDDDYADFISPFNTNFPLDARNMLYAYDFDGKGDGGLKTGYFGFKFLESPTNSTNSLDDDGDGIADENPFNDAGILLTEPNAGPNGYLQGITDFAEYTRNYGPPKPHWQGDEDGDWDASRDDLGADGIPGTGDVGEGDEKPTQGEPNFGFKDVSESDQIGLTSFNAIIFGGDNRPKNDALMWQLIATPNQRPEDPVPNIEQKSDNVFIYGSGPFPLKPGETQRFSIALLMGADLNDLVLNATTAQQILRADYRFAQPPDKPSLVAIPGDRKVSLYWDDKSERSVDPLTGVKDFEGYKLYRSEDYTFSDLFTITDASGNKFLGRPLVDFRGRKAQWDLVNEWKGLHPVEYPGRGVRYDLGDNTGLVHSYVDSTNIVNGKTYYYALVAYDRGDANKINVPPTETQRVIKRDPLTGKFTFDINTAAVIPGPPGAGLLRATLDPKLSTSDRALSAATNAGTGSVQVKIFNDALVRNDAAYDVKFFTEGQAVAYNVHAKVDSTEEFTARDTNAVSLHAANLVPGTVSVRTKIGKQVVDPSKYRVDFVKGSVRGATVGGLTSGTVYEIIFQVYVIAKSRLLNGEDGNPVFDGLRVFAYNDRVGLNKQNSRWIQGAKNNLVASVDTADAGIVAPYPADFEVRFLSSMDTSGTFTPVDTSYSSNPFRRVTVPFRIWNATEKRYEKFFIDEPFATRDQKWQVGEKILIYKPGVDPSTNQTTYKVIFTRPANGTYQPAQNGDIFNIASTKPFAQGDLFTFGTKAVTFDQQRAAEQLNDVFVVPNPFVMFSGAEVPDPRPGEPSERKLYFRNLPPQCTIRIYTTTGELLQTIYKDDSGGSAAWNLLTNEGHGVAYGIYIYHVDAPGVGQKIGRFAVIK